MRLGVDLRRRAEGRPAQLHDAAAAAHLGEIVGAPRPRRPCRRPCAGRSRRPREASRAHRVVAAVGEPLRGLDQDRAEGLIPVGHVAEDAAHPLQISRFGGVGVRSPRSTAARYRADASRCALRPVETMMGRLDVDTRATHDRGESRMTGKAAADEELERLQRDTFGYFLEETNPRNGLVPDNTRDGAPSSIAAVGLALAAYAVGVERSVLTRAEARDAGPHDAPVLLGQPAGRGAGRDRLPGVLLSLPRHADRPAGAGSASCRPSTRRS